MFARSYFHFISRSHFLLIMLFLNKATSHPLLEDKLSLDFPQEEKRKPIVMSAWARKAGGNWKPELLQQMNQNSNNSNSEQGKRGQNEDDYVDSYSDSEEPECPHKMFFHVRGKRCVPYVCPGPKGKPRRDKKTGECILPSYGDAYGRIYTWNRYTHRTTYPQHKRAQPNSGWRVWTG